MYIYIHFVSWTFRCFVAATTRGIDSSARRSCGAPPTFGGTEPRSKLVNPPSWRFETCGKATRVFTDAESIFATRRPETSRSTSPSSVSLANSPVKSLNFRNGATILKFKSIEPTLPKNYPTLSTQKLVATWKLRYSDRRESKHLEAKFTDNFYSFRPVRKISNDSGWEKMAIKVLKRREKRFKAG